MNTSLEYYKKHQETYQVKAKACYKRMVTLSLLRLLVFGLTVFGIYLAFNIWQLAISIGVIGAIVFVKLLSKYTDVKLEKAFNEALVKINQEEIQIASGDFYNRNNGSKYQDSSHFYSLDIDLFGRGSFFQFINRTNINEGTETLASLLKANNIEDIPIRQDAINELSSKSKWRQYYSATSSLVEVETPAKDIIQWLKNYQTFLPNIMKWLPLGFSIATVVLFGLILLNVLDVSLLGYWLSFIFRVVIVLLRFLYTYTAVSIALKMRCLFVTDIIMIGTSVKGSIVCLIFCV